MSCLDKNPLKFREIILNTRKPIVFKQFPLSWPCFKNGLEEWCCTFDQLNNSATDFEKISKNDCLEPQWERKRQVVQMTAMEFLKEHTKKNCSYWSGLNYKRRHELPDKCTSGIDFSLFGFPQVAEDSTLWLCSSGANTPCHYDSYGCNIVVQVFGKKSWLLFPPNAPLTTTRIPYEESSIYCKENFYAPTEDVKMYLEKYKDLAYHVILEPNDVLIVPKHWWHYVEALNISLSVNVWIPLECDIQQQVGECIVKYLIENFVRNSSLTTKYYIMNPNQLTAIVTNDEMLKILKYLVDKLMKSDSNVKSEKAVYKYQYINENNVEELINEIKICRKILPMASLEFKEYLKLKKSRCTAAAESNNEKRPLNFVEEILIDCICSPYIIEAIKKEFFTRYNEQNNKGVHEIA